MNFKQGKVNSNSKSRDGLRIAIIKYENGKFTANVGDKEYKVNAYDIGVANHLYSKPSNNKHMYWTKSTKSNSIKECNFDIVSKYWATVKPNMKVKGIISGDIFIIKKY